MIWQDQRGWT